jgi:hypothetical protein
MGPLPKPDGQRRRRNATLALTQLPSEGRTAPAPEWPLSRPTKAEAELWADLWTKPQAVQWERQESERTVARYVRVCIAAEKPKAPAGLSAEARQFEDRLGLSPMAMLRLKWEIAADEVAEARQAEPASTVTRLRAVDPSAATGA